MASNLEEPSAKRRRSDPEDSHDDQRYRSIKLDMEKYDEWVRELSEDKLISVFELGVKVRETVYFTVDVNQDFMEKALSSQMQPVRETVANIERDVKQQVQSVQENVSRDVTNQMNNLRNDINDALTPKMKQIQDTMGNIEGQVSEQVLKVQANLASNVSGNIQVMTNNVQSLKGDLRNDIHSIQQALVERVDGVVSKVLPLSILNDRITQTSQGVLNHLNAQINSSEQRLLSTIQTIQPSIRSCQEQLLKISGSLEVKSTIKGAVGEKLVINVLKERFPSFTVYDVSRQSGQGDIRMETSRLHKIMIEVKNRESSNVPQTEIDRFKRNLASCSDVKVGILFSMKSGIANIASKFRVKSIQNQYQIYVPNASKDENLIVWSVLMADELADASCGELRTSQVEKLGQLYDEFNDCKEQEKKCRLSLDSLESSAKSLRESMDFILKTVDKTRGKLKKLLRSDGHEVITVN